MPPSTKNDGKSGPGWLPNITGTLARVLTCSNTGQGGKSAAGTGVFKTTTEVNVNKNAPENGSWYNDTRTISFNAKSASSIFSDDRTTVLPAYIHTLYIIKF